MKREGVVEHFLREERSFGEKAADVLTTVSGSWGFIIFLVIFFAAWIWVNVYAYTNAWDPYPFILLNLVVACLATIQVPIIMMSQNRQEKKDRIRSEYDYSINKKAEKEIEEIISKLDSIERKLSKRR